MNSIQSALRSASSRPFASRSRARRPRATAIPVSMSCRWRSVARRGPATRPPVHPTARARAEARPRHRSHFWISARLPVKPPAPPSTCRDRVSGLQLHLVEMRVCRFPRSLEGGDLALKSGLRVREVPSDRSHARSLRLRGPQSAAAAHPCSDFKGSSSARMASIRARSSSMLANRSERSRRAASCASRCSDNPVR